jgi:hypothetical protein
MKHLHFEHTDQFETLFKTNSREITDIIVHCIQDAFQFQKESADIFSISFGEDEVAFEISLPKSQWQTAVQKCLDSYHEWECTDEVIDTYLLLKSIKEWEETK